VIAVALSGGGERVVAWQVGVLAGLADGGVDLRRAPAVIGTSAGALAAARLTADVDPRADAGAIVAGSAYGDAGQAFAVLAGAWPTAGWTLTQRRRAFGQLAVRHSPGGEDEFVDRVGRRIVSGTWPEALRVAAIDADSGERVVFDAASGVSPARAVAASRAIPTLLPPVTIDGRRFVDGALGSATNADALVGVDAAVVLVITGAPAQATERGPERFWREALDDEMAALEGAGHEVVVVHASPAEQAAMGDDPMSAATAHLAVAAGRQRGYALAAQIRPRRAA
jgi:NTE family protein